MRSLKELFKLTKESPLGAARDIRRLEIQRDDLLEAAVEAEATFRVVAGTDPDREVAALSQLRAVIALATETNDAE